MLLYVHDCVLIVVRVADVRWLSRACLCVCRCVLRLLLCMCCCVCARDRVPLLSRKCRRACVCLCVCCFVRVDVLLFLWVRCRVFYVVQLLFCVVSPFARGGR